MSFMGKGVTKSALISLLHLSHEMTSMNKDKVKFSNCSANVRLPIPLFYYILGFFFRISSPSGL